MPIYVYKCNTCQATLEALQKFSDAPLTECDSCGGRLQKQFTSEFGLSFRGSGFYITDYKKGSNGNKSETAASSSD